MLTNIVKLRKQKSLFYCALVVLCLTSYQFIPFEPTTHDVDLARKVVEKRTSQPIGGTEIQANGEIVIRAMPLSGIRLPATTIIFIRCWDNGGFIRKRSGAPWLFYGLWYPDYFSISLRHIQRNTLIP